MKKAIILFISVLVLGMTFSSCSNDDNSPAPTPASVEGKWIYNKMSYTYLGGTNPEEDYVGNELGCIKDYIELNAGGVYNDGDYTGSDCVLVKNNGTWSKSGNIITVLSPGLAAHFELVSVSSSELKVKRTDTQWGILSLTVILHLQRDNFYICRVLKKLTLIMI
nr:lipocalin family protein [uncultured Flavobacterium sp.]